MSHHRAGSGWSTHSIPTTAAPSSNPRSASGSSTASTSYPDATATVTGSTGSPRRSARSTTTASFRKSSSPLMRNDAPSFVAPSWSRPSPIQQQQQQQQQQIPHRPRHYQHSSQSSESNGTWSPLGTTPSGNSTPLVTASHLPASSPYPPPRSLPRSLRPTAPLLL
ncbi:BZ3500_MvSof-1268-A1-R1_Chr9g10307 [Microbotryum saponariae]|uniref:BZ3500_MvSof-1268-A1-R1_Chr9g10307 protein n=1 Tax=Microbotryum saponariae TaxID=289078 RepID=A0A2X0N591_9BASI|nr:BZ3501_MvSof-1269-A2-R1_Chr9g10057 [Microbotryum saponariae]SCZ99887.1 BZ3500_MvSof-1268-A1-R1_Chr9g10307 [Microbotryum saponariae]